MKKCDDHHKLIAERILAARETKGWSQRDLASKAGVSQKTISNLESPTEGGSYTLPKLEAVARALGMGVWELLAPPGEVEAMKLVRLLPKDLSVLHLAQVIETLPAKDRATLSSLADSLAQSANAGSTRAG